MADNKQLNYNYIRNTLSNNKLLVSDGGLGLGVLVNNLAVPLTADNIVNPNYQELYGNKMLTEA